MFTKGKKRLLATLVTLLLFAAMLSGCAGGTKPSEGGNGSPAETESEKIVLKLGHINPETGNYHQYALKFKELVETRSNGQVEIDIYPAGQLGYDRELLESLQFNNLDLSISTSSPIANFVPAFMALDFPFIFDDWDHVMRFIESDAAVEMMNEGADKNLIGLGMLARGFRSTTNSKKPLNSVADFKGMKMRVIESPIYIKTFEALGATVTAMSWGEVFTALQQGTIEAVELDYRTLYDERVYEVQKYLTGTEHIFAFATLMASKSKFESLPADVQQLLKDCAMEAGVEVSKAQIPIIEGYIQKLQDAGMEFNEIDREELRAKMGPVRDWFVKEYGDKYLKAIESCR
ncbi:MAG: TRAP-type C4-dicarboxylate transport system, periplasmic component [Firmicutes bacterium]|nr:TRAP-type C4-dicarboxylate transport system, periplasmic component [Bacillota bacterium]MDI6706243.1 TRAP transporter substrate-binding protein [Bacillota bacterium]